ncbi:hypothetical protein SAMD00019534_018280, partial [Acytostelium subglobosum LB1]|uniref:hypothetical protein n=1 Tax=Acytostelium subglobosum LB1 TaxID=1410327 RepID=UPI000644A8C9
IYRMSDDFNNLRNFVLGHGDNDPSQLKAPEGQVRLEITHSVLSDDVLGANNWKNFQLDQTVQQLKEKLHRFVGTETKYMTLQVREADKMTVRINQLDDDNKLLSNVEGLTSGLNIHIIDSDPNNYIAQLQDTSSIERAQMSDAEYSQRDGTYRKWKQDQAAAASAAATQSSTPAPTTTTTAAVVDEFANEPTDIKVGDRCLIISDDLGRIGSVAYIGKVEGAASGYWIGISLDLPQGKNNGTLKGVRYFDCQGDKYGCFVRAKHLKVGDYPEEEI